MSGSAVVVEEWKWERNWKRRRSSNRLWHKRLTKLGTAHDPTSLFPLASSSSPIVSTFRRPAMLSAQRYTEGLSMCETLGTMCRT
jgi:hypothetical protein